jgi:predicted nucleic acid-binding protein
MGKPKYVLDSNVFISFVKGLLGAMPSLSLPLDGKLYISVVTRIEALAWPLMTAAEEAKIRAVLRYFIVIPLNRKVECITIPFRAQTKIKLPDSIVAASSILLNATLLSNDDKLLKTVYPGYKVKSV